jgi:hypothetical protein
MRHIWKLSYIVAVAAAVWAMTPEASAEDALKVAVDQRGAWETAAPELGQQAGIFKKQGLTLEVAYPRAEAEIETAVITGRADVGVDVGIVGCCAPMPPKTPQSESSAQPDRVRQLLVRGDVFADQDGHGYQWQDHRLFEGRCGQSI